MPKHIAILLFLLASLFLLALLVRSWLIDPSFYRFGDYRAAAVPELAAATPLYRGGDYCLSCHEDSFAYGTGAAHSSVQCEVCHGVDPEHPDNPATHVPADTIELCTTCHQAMPARPAGHPQIEMAEHPSTDEAGGQCHDCHDPHSPGGVEPTTGLAEAGSPAVGSADSSSDLLAVVPKCAKCHGEFGEGRRKNPPIAGMESDAFVDLMNLYASGTREHKAMNRYAGELSAEEIVALSSYYQDLAAEPPD